VLCANLAGNFMNKILIIGGLVLIIISLVTFPEAFRRLGVQSTGALVTVTIVKLPNCKNWYKNKFVSINFEGSNYILRAKCKYLVNLEAGMNVQMLHKSGSDIFLFEKENVLFNLLSSLAIGLIGLVISVVATLKERKPRTTLACQKPGCTKL
jgi:hypothetical protein